ncbi:hypothetical protein CR970_04015 [Candidatus Saccharibacteria bacterium]|nr:MAG: hypothetical protein CR970_04015 [Candidatus Saccharibacteria bacterium]
MVLLYPTAGNTGNASQLLHRRQQPKRTCTKQAGSFCHIKLPFAFDERLANELFIFVLCTVLG